MDVVLTEVEGSAVGWRKDQVKRAAHERSKAMDAVQQRIDDRISGVAVHVEPRGEMEATVLLCCAGVE